MWDKLDEERFITTKFLELIVKGRKKVFIDQARIFVKSGKGGDGKVSFHTAKYVPNGGPDGGDGGKGGDVIMVASSQLNTLQSFRYRRKYVAEDGEIGGRRKKFGKNGADLLIQVPIGTLVKDADTGEIYADLTEEGEKVVLARGGKGGKGNVHFANSIRQAPNFAKPGEEAEEFYIDLELKLLADVGLIGLPNVGKSTLLSVITAARPKIGDYHFTTIEPNLGICSVDEFHFAIADIPGLIEGAAEGKGLGHDFLKHIERTKLLVHLVDVSGSEGRNPLEDFEMVNKELQQFSSVLAERPQMVLASKIDLASEEQVENFAKTLKKRGFEVYPICGPIHEGTQEVVHKMAKMVKELPATSLKIEVKKKEKIYKFEEEKFRVEKVEDGYEIKGKWIERLLSSINLEDTESLQYFQRQLKWHGVIDALLKEGIEEGDLVFVGEHSFEYLP